MVACLLAVACWGGGRRAAGRPRRVAPSSSWGVHAAGPDHIRLPADWFVMVDADGTYEVAGPHIKLRVRLHVVAPSLDESSLRHAVEQLLAELPGVPLTLSLNSQPEGWLYDEASWGESVVFAACAVEPPGAPRHAIVAIVRGGTDGLVSREEYRDVGGREFLCTLAESLTVGHITSGSGDR